MKPFVIVTDEQRTDAWRAARVGMLTGTDARSMLATIKSGEAAARRDLRMSLVVERLTGEAQEDGFVSADMKRGAEIEPDALCAYELATDAVVQPVGFLRHPSLLAGCSPDGQVNDYAGIVEIKCPRSANHVGYWRSGAVPSEHMHQITHNLWITGAAWCDFVSFDPRMPEGLRLFVRRVRREDVDLKAYELVVRMFLAECDKELDEMKALAASVAA